MRKLVLIFALFLGLVSVADAGPFRRRAAAGSCASGSCAVAPAAAPAASANQACASGQPVRRLLSRQPVRSLVRRLLHR